MRFEVVQHYPADPATVLDVYTDPTFYPELGDLPRTGRPEVLGHDRAGDRLTMRLRFRFTADLPPAALAVIDRDRLTWVEETVYDLARATASVRLLPDHYPDRLVATARVVFVPDPRDAAGCVRRIQGDLKVRMPLVGGKVERAIVDGLEEYLDAEQTAVCHRLAR